MKHDLKILEDVLLFWEDWNTSVSFMYLQHLVLDAFGNGPATDYKKPTTGSEVNDIHCLAKAIPEYKTLRTLLESKNTQPLQEKNFDDFLPRIPQVLESKNRDGRMGFALENLSSAHEIPFFLGEWAITKKVCVINKPDLIPLIHPFTEDGTNYLNSLPYDNFLLELGTPLVCQVTFESRSATISFKNIIINRKENTIGIFMIPNEISDHCYSEDDILRVEKMISLMDKAHKIMYAKNKSQKSVRKMGKSLKEVDKLEAALETSFTNFNFSQLLFSTNFFDIEKEEYSLLGVNFLNVGSEPRNGSSFLMKFISLLNGFCKVVAEARDTIAPLSAIEVTLDTDQESIAEETPTASTTALPEIENYEWYEVPENSVDFLKMKRHKGETKAVYVQGSGKSPHPRMRHPRRYRNPDGTIRKEVWVKASFIHKEKLAAGAQSKAGVLKI